MKEFTLKNENGIEMVVSDFGGIVRQLRVPDRDGRFDDVVLGFDAIESYFDGSPYFGALVGRYGNRIAKGGFSLDGRAYTLAKNNGENHLHGGIQGFDKQVWKTERIEGEGFTGLVLKYRSEDGEEGYPGNLDVAVAYKLTNANEWIIEYKAVVDQSTVVNLTQHAYFNLRGHSAGDILGHELVLEADGFTPTDDTLIPTGEIRSVEGSPFDFRTSCVIGERIDDADTQLEQAGGYDHNFVLNKSSSGALERAALVYEPESGRTMEVLTTEPGVQFYSGNFLDGSAIGKRGTAYASRSGLCLETQHFPDSPNQPQFPSTRLDPGDVYVSTTVYRFGSR